MDNFENITDQMLHDLAHQCEERLLDGAEIDLEDGILTINMDDGGTYLINRHLPTRQIWLSSPKSGAWHFAPVQYNDTQKSDWTSTRGDKISIYDLLNRELSPLMPFHRP